MRDVNDADAALLELADQAEQRLDFLLGDADVGSSMMITRASNEIALAISTTCCAPTAQVANARSRVEVEVQFARARLCAAHASGESRSAQATERLAAEKDVLGDAQVGNQIQFLIDGRNPSRCASRGLRNSTVGRPSESRPHPAETRRPGCSSTSICRRRSRPAAR